MFDKSKQYAETYWRFFGELSLFWKVFLIFPVGCAVALTLTVGNMGLALMGTAVAINSLVAGWIGGAVLVFLGKAGIIVATDRQR